MLHFDTFKIGLEVEFVDQNDKKTIQTGVIRYKGVINGKEGDWVGVETREPIGYCDGRLMGNSYFSCPENCGLFLNANDLRLVKNKGGKK